MMSRPTLALLSLLMSLHPVAADEPSSFPLSTDTPAYCVQLARQVADRHSPLADVQRLLNEGRDLCDRGQVRGGIRRLRRALVMLHHRVVKED